MKFKIKTSVLKTAIDYVMHGISNMSTTPILENIMIKVNYNNIVFTSNNLEMAIEYIVNKDLTIDLEGAICIPSKIFSNYINLLRDDNVKIELLSNNTIEIKTPSSNTKIKGNSVSDFPVIPVIRELNIFNIKSNILKKAIEKTIFSSAEGAIRPNLAGIYFNINQNIIKFATTDSFRLTEYKVELDEEIISSYNMILPSRTAYELKSIISEDIEIKVICRENQIVFSFGNLRFYSRLLTGNFPEYSGFFPTSYNTKIIVNKQDLIMSLKKINLLSKENNYSIKITFSNEEGFIIETSQTELGEAKTYLVGSMEGEDSIVGLNGEYMLQVLNIIDITHISISFESSLSPILFMGVNDNQKVKKDEFRHIIMPLKI